MIEPKDIPSVDEDTARTIIVVARTIAPCLDSLEGEPRKDALAVLRGVAAELGEPGSRRIRSQSVDGAAVSYERVGSAFNHDDRVALAALCGASVIGGLPAGSFPEDRLFDRLWPGERY